MTVVTVYSNDELFQAFRDLAASEDGGTILVAPSDTPYSLSSYHYGSDQIDAPVTITSLDTDAPATFTQIKLREHENVTLNNIKVHAAQDNLGGRYETLVQLHDITNVAITNSHISSDAFGTPGVNDQTAFNEGANAIQVRSSSGFTFENNTVTDVKHSVSLLETTDVLIAGNDISQVQGDFIRLGGVQDVEITQNNMHDPLGATRQYNHSDFIQLWGTNIKTNNERIDINNNIMDSSGASYQLIFGRNEDQDENGFVFQDINVENNVLYGSSYQTIGLYQMDNVSVVNNTVIYNIDALTINDDGTNEPGPPGWVRVPDATNLTLENNLVLDIQDGGSNNIETSLVEQGQIFVNVYAGGSGDLRDLQIPVDHPYHGQVGSSLLWMPDSTPELTAAASPTYSNTDNSVVTFDAGYSTYSNGLASEVDGVLIEWIFADGTVLTGATTTFDFVEPGRHEYTLRVTLPDGQVDEITRTIDIEGSTPVRFETVDGALINTGQDSAARFTLGSNLELIEDGFVLAPEGTLTLSRDNDWIYDSAAFDYGLTLTPLNGSHGVFLYLHKGALTARIEADGSVSLSMTTTDGLVKISTAAGVFLGPDDTHRINIQFDGEAGFVRIVVDGEIAAEGEASGQTLPLEYWGLTIGRPWNATLTAEVTEIVLSNESPLAAQPEVDPAALVYSLDFADMAGSGPIRIKTDAIVETEFGPALDITDGGSMIPRAADFLYDQTSFDIALTLSAQDDPAGTLLYMHKTLAVELREDGRIEFMLTTDEGRQKIVSSVTDLNDGGLHEVRIGFDSAAGTMQIVLDGEIIAQGPHGGTTPPVKFWGLSLGHPWSDDTANVMVHQIEGFDTPTETGPFTGPQTDDIIFLDFEDGSAVNAIDSDAETKLEGEVQFVTENGDTALAFDRAGNITVDRDAQSLFDVDSFTIGADIALAELGNQEILRIHQSLSLTAHNGKTKFSFTNSEGVTFTVEDQKGTLTVGQEHGLQVLYDADKGVLQLMIDDVVVDQADAWGSTKDQEYWGLTIGGTFGQSFAGTLDNIVFSESAAGLGKLGPTDDAAVITGQFVPDETFF